MGATKKKKQDHKTTMLLDLTVSPLGPVVVTTGRHYIGTCEMLVAEGLASVSRSSVGEADERATYTITEAGRRAAAAVK